MNPPARYLHVRPQGIAQWMTQVLDARQPDQHLLRHLLLQPLSTTTVDVHQLSQGSGLERATVARSLFELQRLGSISVSTTSSAALPRTRPPAIAMQEQLRRICQDTATIAVVADPDGLCLASHGMGNAEAQRLAAGLVPTHGTPTAHVMLLYVEHRPCRLYCNSTMPFEHEAIVDLVRSLLELMVDLH